MPSAEVFTSQSTVSAERLTTIRGLVNEALDDALSEDDWEHALGGWHVVLLDAGAILAHAAVVPRAIAVAGSQFPVAMWKRWQPRHDDKEKASDRS